MIRFGLCCIFRAQAIKFRQTTARVLRKYDRVEQLTRLSELALHNASSLLKALEFVLKNDIGAFRVLSQILPLYTQPEVGYTINDLPAAREIKLKYDDAKDFVQKHDIRLSFHPDQFVVLSSPDKRVVENSIRELIYQCEVAELIGAESVNIHLGGVYGNKSEAIKRFRQVYESLPVVVKKHLTLENDDISYTVKDLYPLCIELGIPLVYDVHHHRCNPDGLNVEAATEKSIATWDALTREPHFHISSPKNGWNNGTPRPHSDYIDFNDFPACWLGLGRRVTIDIEAKAKELAIAALQKKLCDRN
jgi:UV DNA damage endonuclease